jgi:replicative DNA helicase
MSTVKQFQPNRQISGSPRDLEAEQGVLGAILAHNSLIEQLEDELDPEMFWEALHSRIYVAMRDLVLGGRSADPVTVTHAMAGDEAFERADGAEYLMLMVEKAPAIKIALDYAGIVREMWRRSRLIQLGDSLSLGGRDGQSADEMVAHAEADLIAAEVHARGISLVTATEAVDSVLRQYANPEQAFGVNLGLDPIDDVTGGMMPGELWIIAGRPGMGKSALCNTAGLNIAMNGRGPKGERLGVIEICCEMTVEQMMRRHIADLCFEMFGTDGPTYSGMRRRVLTGAQQRMMAEAAARLREMDTMRMLYRTGLTIRGIRSLARRQKAVWARKGIALGLVTIDHMGLVRGTQGHRGRTEDQGDVARDTLALAGELEVPMIALLQLSRRCEERDNKRPILSDLRDSGEWEQAASGVIGVYRDAYYALREPEPKRADLKIQWDERCASVTVDALLLKVREGQTQSVKLWADIGRNAIRSHQPEQLYRSSQHRLIDLLDPDQALPSDEEGLF